MLSLKTQVFALVKVHSEIPEKRLMFILKRRGHEPSAVNEVLTSLIEEKKIKREKENLVYVK